MKRVLLVIAYDGTNYKGFAEQKSVPTIEGTVNRAIHGLTGENISVIGASRTDAGVHAYGNLAVFDTESTIPPEKFSFALNHLLPEDIRIVQSKEVPQDFHPRHCDSRKTYEYRVLNTKWENPIFRNFTYHFSMELDVERMNRAAGYLVGTHDFTSFCNVDSQALDHVRTVYEVRCHRCGDEVIISVTGAGFLYNMVRIIAGTLLQIGRGKGEPEDVIQILEACNRGAAGPTAPPQGLFLMKYEIPGII